MTAVPAGRVAVITGSSRGLGAGMARYFAAAGLHLGLCARHCPTVPLGTGPTESLCAAVDVTDHAALSDFMDSILARFGRIDLWVNNAGILAPIEFLADADPGEVARNIAVNVVGVANGSSLFAGHVRSRAGSGVLINISSGAAVHPYAGWGPYCASKAAVDQLTRVIALEEGPHGLSAYSVSPGIIDTEMQEMIRGTDEAAFPEVERFRQFATDDVFSSMDWVARHLLEMAFGQDQPESVVARIPDESISTQPQ
jgi:NAD(P)-dependent dehydrogenase (short-subunit alcohol dehydrogenase family)